MKAKLHFRLRKSTKGYIILTLRAGENIRHYTWATTNLYTLVAIKEFVERFKCDPDHVANLINKAKPNAVWHSVFK